MQQHQTVRASPIFSALFAVVGTAMIAERVITGEGQLVAGVVIVAFGIAFFYNWVDVWPAQIRIRTPFRNVTVVAPQPEPGKPRHIRDGETGEVHALPIGVLAIEVLQPRSASGKQGSD